MGSKARILLGLAVVGLYFLFFVPWGPVDDRGRQYVAWTEDGSLVRLSQVYRGTSLGMPQDAPLILPRPRFRVWKVATEHGTLYAAPQPYFGFHYLPSVLMGSILWTYQSDPVGRAGQMHIERSHLGLFWPFRSSEDLANFELVPKEYIRDISFSSEGQSAVGIFEADQGIVLFDLKGGRRTEISRGWAGQPQFTKKGHIAFYLQEANPAKAVSLFSEGLISESYRDNLRKGPPYSLVLAERNGRVIKSLGTSITNYASKFRPKDDFTPFRDGPFNTFNFDISPDETLIATHEGVFDWSGKQIARYPSPIVSGPAWSPDGKEVAGIKSDGSVQIFRIE